MLIRSFIILSVAIKSIMLSVIMRSVIRLNAVVHFMWSTILLMKWQVDKMVKHPKVKINIKTLINTKIRFLKTTTIVKLLLQKYCIYKLQPLLAVTYSQKMLKM
jgi:hypothetical protein